MRGLIAAFMAALFIAASGVPASAQKAGGNLRVTHRDNPPSASIHEEATISTVMPFMSIYNNLVVFDPASKQNAPLQLCLHCCGSNIRRHRRLWRQHNISFYL